MNNINNDFIIQTAKDYNIAYEDVKYIYIHYWETGEFYQKLEEHIN